MPFDLLPSGSGDRLKAVGMTRAGLLEAALQGTFAVAGARFQEDGEEVARPFSLRADDFDALLAAFLDEALKVSAERSEAYQSVSFDLITAAEAKGSYVGKRAEGFSDPLKAVKKQGLKAERNEGGVWEVEIAYER